ncbi:MAG TPA: DNA mismatch repair protein MutS [Anaerolineae bacterium]|nr:DNA mismatch repair protein MutS [Anaerolineae bacterium]
MDTERLTPMLSQYRQIKARFPDAIVLFRLGDFFETFEEDARIAARELELVLTSRSFAKGVRLPMAGVPHHHVQSYIAKLIDRGYKVALVEQLEDPKKTKKLVKRDVIRVITPGTVVEDALLRAKSENYLAAIVKDSTAKIAKSAKDNSKDFTPSASSAVSFGLSLIDLSTGEFATTQIDGVDAESKLFDELQRVQASEFVLPPALINDDRFVARLKAIRSARLSPIEDHLCEITIARQTLLDHFRVKMLAGFGCEHLPLAAAAAGAVLAYLKSNQPSNENTSPLLHLNQLWTFSLAEYMTLDLATRRNLELVHASPLQADGREGKGSLFGVLDQTVTAMGARLLKRWVQQPLLDLDQIHARLGAVAELHDDAFLREDLRRLLDGLYDVERLVGRIGFGNANARDLIALKVTLVRLPQIKARLSQARTDRLRDLERQLDQLTDVAELVDRAVVDHPPILIREGGLIKHGYDPTLDELRDQVTQGKTWLNDLEEKERTRSGIKSLRVRYNEVFGFFIEVPRSAAKQVPKNYERRATITHAERYVTPELKAKETHILAAEDRMKDLEYDLFVQLRREVAQHAARLQTAARVLAQIDALVSLAEVAARYGYVKPIVDDGDAIEIKEGRHPVVERFLHDESFVPNDVRLDAESQRVIILTGPNMSGKSVFVRQVALIVLLAQIGSFVPASYAHLGLIDRIFTRVGASDDIAQGRSTFLVEMSEASHILRHAMPRSLIILDEVGRGTSTYDGISLAWAIAEELHNVVGAKTLFATHYHELTQLETDESIQTHGGAIKNFTMAVKEQGHDVIFLRQVIPGGAEKSFGIHVARLAGLPDRVVNRAEEILAGLETSRQVDKAQAQAISSSERAVLREERTEYDARIDVWRGILQQLIAIDIANMTPLQALNMLNEMQLIVKRPDS